MPKKSTTTKSKTVDTQEKTQPSVIGDNTKLSLVIPADKAKETYEKALRRAALSMKLAGFRKGHAPLQLVEENVGKEKLINWTLEQLLPDAYRSLIEKENRHPLTSPDVSVKSVEQGKDWELEIQIAEKPTITLGDYQAVIKEAHKTAKKEISDLEKEQAKKSTEKDDKKAAEQKPLTDAQKEDMTLRAIFKALIEKIRPIIPELLIQDEVRRQLQELGRELEQYKISIDDYLKRRGMTFEQLTTESAVNALSGFQLEFIIDSIIEEQKITTTDEDITAYLSEIKSEKKLSELEHDIKHRIEHTIQHKKITAWLLSLGK